MSVSNSIPLSGSLFGSLFISSARMLTAMTLLTGLVYPLAMTGVGQLLFSHAVNGSLVKQGEQVVGSELLAQKFADPKNFWPRPSAIDYNPLPSGGSNLGPISPKLKEAAEKNRAAFAGATVPQDLIYASASGLDPHISPESALIQVDRVSSARGVTKEKVTDLVKQLTEERQLGFLGERRVNVLKLNLALSQF